MIDLFCHSTSLHLVLCAWLAMYHLRSVQVKANAAKRGFQPLHCSMIGYAVYYVHQRICKFGERIQQKNLLRKCSTHCHQSSFI